MASVPEYLHTTGFDESVSPARKQPIALYWRVYWLLVSLFNIVALGLLFANLAPAVAGFLLILSGGMVIVGLIPSLVSTAEKQIGWSLQQRNPDYHHQWSAGAIWWWRFHWIMLLILCSVIIAAGNVKAGVRELFLILIVFLSITYVMMIGAVLAWRWRRMRLAHLAGLEELQSFALLTEHDELFAELSSALPMFTGKSKNRCPFLLRRYVGDWSVLLFDWHDINKQPPRREWITVALIGLHQPLPLFNLQPTERVEAVQLHWWHIFLEFPFGLIIFIIGAISHVASKLKSKPPLTISHTPALTKGHVLECFHLPDVQKILTPEICQEVISTVHKKKRFLMVNREWLLLGAHRKEVAPQKLGGFVADALRLADLLERQV